VPPFALKLSLSPEPKWYLKYYLSSHMKTLKYAHIRVKINDIHGLTTTMKVNVVDQGCTTYFNCQHLLIKLPSEARTFLDYLCEKMSAQDNSIKIDKYLKADYITHISSITSNKFNPSIQSLNRYVTLLKNLTLIITSGNSQREFYNVNPKYFFKGFKIDRVKTLKTLVKEKVRLGQSLNGLIDRPA
jgi:hypothetical protein